MDLVAAMELGRALVPATFARTSSCDAALANLRDWAQSEGQRRPALVRSVVRIAQRRGGIPAVLWAARWASCGFPQVTLGHKVAASLMATRMAPEACGEVVAPWPAFLVVVPNRLVRLPHPGKPGEVVDIDHLTVFHAGGFVQLTASSRNEDFTMGVDRATLAGGLVDEYTPDLGPESEGYPLEVVHARALAMLWRLAVAIHMELSDRSRVGGATPEPITVGVEAKVPSRVQTVRLSRTVLVDCREAVRAFIHGRRRGAPVVQTLVRGHWKRQVWGEKQSERRWIHVEPYWRGPEDAPFRVRTHRLVGETPRASGTSR